MHNRMAAGWFYSPTQIYNYILSRPTTLKPPRSRLRNPVSVLKELDRHQWLMFLGGFLGWTWDAFDFFTVSLTVTEIAKEFGVRNSDVTWGLTLTLMLRSVGALIFGALSDRYGRKWPMIINLALFVVFELASGFCNTLPQFLGVRSLYGIAMGGLFGPAAATALEDLPYDARGLLSGLFQQGYATGYLLAAIFYRALVPTTTHGWRTLFWFGAVPPLFIIIFRWYLPETNTFQVMKAEREARALAENSTAFNYDSGVVDHNTDASIAKAWFKDVGAAVKTNWVLFIYMIILMTFFNSCAHGSQDFYPTFLKNQIQLDPSYVTVISVVGQIGALTGGTILGYISTFSGRRLIMIVACVFGGAMVPAYTMPHNLSLIASGFFMQFFVGGAWGVIPIHLSELSPPALRTTAIGLTYQLGNLASSASATIQAVIGEKYPLPPHHGVSRFDYGKVIAIFMGAIWAGQALLLFIGPEMSEGERKEYAASANDLEASRKRGVNLADIGRQRALIDYEAGLELTEGKAEKITVAEHLEKVTSIEG